MKGSLELTTNLEQMIIRERRLTQHHSMVITIHSSGGCTVTIQRNKLTTVLMEEKSAIQGNQNKNKERKTSTTRKLPHKKVVHQKPHPRILLL